MKTILNNIGLLVIIALLPACTSQHDSADHSSTEKTVNYTFSLYPAGNSQKPLYQGDITARPYETVEYESKTSNFYNKGVEVVDAQQTSKTKQGEVMTGLTLKITPYQINSSTILSHISMDITRLCGHSRYQSNDLVIELPTINIMKIEQKLLMKPGEALYMPTNYSTGSKSSCGKYVFELTARLPHGIELKK